MKTQQDFNNKEEIFFLKSQLLDFTRRNLKPSKGRNLFICPFCHSGEGPHKTGAFSINIKKNYYKCFSCDESGDIFNLYEFLHNCDFSQAIRELKEIYNLTSSNYYTENFKQNSNFSIYNKNTQQTNYKRETKEDSHELSPRLKEQLKRQEEFLKEDREKQEQKRQEEQKQREKTEEAREDKSQSQEEQKINRTQEQQREGQSLEDIKETINFIKEKYNKFYLTQKDIKNFLSCCYSLDFLYNNESLNFLVLDDNESQEEKETERKIKEISQIKEEINFFYKEINKKDSQNLNLYILLYKFFSQEITFFIYENEFFRLTIKETEEQQREGQSQEQNQENQKNYFFIYKEDKTNKHKEEYKLNKNSLKIFLFAQDDTKETEKINNILKSIFILKNEEKRHYLGFLEDLINKIKEEHKIKLKKELNFINYFTDRNKKKLGQQRETTTEEDRRNYIFILLTIIVKLQKQTKRKNQDNHLASYKRENILFFLFDTVIKELLFYNNEILNN